MQTLFFTVRFSGKSAINLGSHIKLNAQESYRHNLGGKTAVISFYRQLHSSKKLLMTNHGKPTIVIFFLDKDIDDILRTKIRSAHVIYTKYYDVQNYIFVYGDIAKALASAASCDEEELRESSFLQGDWCCSAAERWKDWIVLCLLCQIHQVNYANYRIVSQINNPLNANVDSALRSKAIEEVRLLLGWTNERMDQELIRLNGVVTKLYKKGLHDIVFKGKWYAVLLEHDFRDAFSGKELAFSGLSDRVLAALPVTLDFSQAWSDAFTEPVTKIITKAMSNN